ncbi:PREDICTED: 2-hydroxyisoflavanone dehydratase-like [Fragaria vesca subsp. vesca]|uniref:2-hydroxyisoflavanone dehydratase-like n=1 Tax=Fragaria vesca subsp. vesca TaxID=101020 RepID=UPI0002C3267E|nr:PREDICTED: 2-hydroxyisoflavanone dehydratase-like [Fragaria vesca subsp. vesca]
MAATADHSDVELEFRFFRVHKDGTIHRTHPTIDKVPPSDDPTTDVRSKDVTISTDPPISARIFLPKSVHQTKKLPVLLYLHGGGFCFESPCSATYHNYVSTLAASANVIAVSVEYGLFPTRPIPACYDDSWAALQWVATGGSEPWLNDYADLTRVFVGGDSAGGNIAHTLLFRVGSIGLPGAKVVGAVLVHPYFGGTDDDKMWLYMNKENEGLQDRRLVPATEDLRRLGCERVLVFVAEMDHLKGGGKRYMEELKKSGWTGSVEVEETVGKDHCFHLAEPNDELTTDLIKKNGFVY